MNCVSEGDADCFGREVQEVQEKMNLQGGDAYGKDLFMAGMWLLMAGMNRMNRIGWSF